MASILKKKQKKRDNKNSLSDLKTLGHQLLSSRSHINNLPLLLTFVNPNSSPQFALESLLSLQSFFTPLLPDLPPSSSKPSSAAADSQEDPEFIYRTWLRSKFNEFVQSLIVIAISPQSEDTLRVRLSLVHSQYQLWINLYYVCRNSLRGLNSRP